MSNKYIYLHGGHNGDIWLDDLYLFESNNNIWSKVTVFGLLPSARACHTLSKVDRKLYMFGGYDGIKCYNDIEIFDIETKTWIKSEIKGNIPLARNAHTITVVNKHLILFGGHSGNKHLKDLYVFDTENLSWYEPKFSGESPEGLRGHTATHLGNKIFVFGGYDGKGRSNELFVLNLEDFEWRHISDKDNFPGARQRHSAIAVDNKRIIIFGGFDGFKWLNDLHIFDASLIIENFIQKLCEKNFSNHLKDLIDNKEYSDFIFIIDNKQIYSHKCKLLFILGILSTRSEFFKKKFESEEKIRKMEISNISYKSFIRVLEFIYTGKVDNLEVEECFEILSIFTIK